MDERKRSTNQIPGNGNRKGIDRRKMKLILIRNMEAYLRKIAIDGYIMQVDQ